MNKKEYKFDETAALLSSFMRSSERAIINRFASLPRATKLTFPLQFDLLPAVFIPGTRKDRVLLVAHYDTVWTGTDVKLAKWGTCLVSNKAKTGIGADDRAGIAALWELRDSGHSILIVPDEEVGCMGSRAVIQNYRKELGKHRFAIQFDRRGSHDIVTYDCCNTKFDRFMETNMPGFAKAWGSVSDISVLCPPLGIAGANLSIGFDEEHTEGEFVDVYDWIRTMVLVRELLANPCPHYVYKHGKKMYQAGRFAPYNYAPSEFDSFEDWHDHRVAMQSGSQFNEQPDAYYWCRDCAMMFDADEIDDTEICGSCGGPLSLEAYETVGGRTHG